MQRCRNVDATQKTKTPGTADTEGLLSLVLAALADQAVKPLAQIVGYYLRCDSLKKCDKATHVYHLLSATRGSEKGRNDSIT